MKALILILALLIKASNCFNLTLVVNLLSNFNFKSPMTILSNEKIMQIKLIKNLFQNGNFLKFDDFTEDFCQADLNDLMHLAIMENNQRTLIFPMKPSLDQSMDLMKCSINEEVYLFNDQTKEIFETYVINDHKIVRTLGKLNEDYKMEWYEDFSLVKRRSNFQGKHFKALTGTYGSWTVLNKTFLSEAHFFTNNGTYLVTNYVSGILIDVMEIMKRELNFTMDYYVNKVRGTHGHVIDYGNGTFGGTGNIPDVFFGKVDMLVVAIAIKVYRTPYLDFLPASEYYPCNSSFSFFMC